MDNPRQVICCGNVAFDLLTRPASRPGDLDLYATPGGSVLNVAILASRLGLGVSVMAKTGEDFLGRSLMDTMRREGISTRFIVRDERVKTGLAFARINEKGDSSYLFYKTEGPEACFNKRDITGQVFKGTEVFHTGSAYSYDDHSWKDALRLAEKGKASGACVSYDPNWRGSRIKDKAAARSRAKRLLRLAEILKLSDSDAEGLFGTKTLDAALKRLGRDAFITLGEKGSFYWNGKRKISRQAFKIKVADTIGAGDAYTAGLIYMYSCLGRERFREEMPRNLCFASAVSAIVCTARGATTALKDIHQVRRFIGSHLGEAGDAG